MRFDKFTTQFQQAFADAQSLAVGNDNPYIEPQHLLVALISQQGGGAASLLARAGANVGGLRSAHALTKEKAGRTAMKSIKLMKDDAAAVEKESENIKKRYTQIFKV